jgi:hypothetical protein
MWLLPRLRYVFARHPSLHWLLAGCCAALIATRLHGIESAAHRSTAAWGTTRPVWVSDGDVAPGSPIHPVERRYPTAMVPTVALRSVPPDARAARAVARGQVLLPDDLAGGRTPPPDWVVLAVPAEHAPRFARGDGVAVLHTGVLACDGLVADPSGDRLEIAVPVPCAATVSAEISTVVVARHTAPTYRATDDRP